MNIPPNTQPVVLVGLNSAGHLIPVKLNDDGSLAVTSTDISTYPTTDPHVVGAKWNNGGFVCISQG